MGRVVFNANDAEEWNSRGEKVILVRYRDFTGRHRWHECGPRNPSHLPGRMTSHRPLWPGMGKSLRCRRRRHPGD